MEISNGDWPADMLIEILLRLPVKSIIRFKCVANTWCHLFQNPTFVSQYHRISKMKNKQQLLVAYFKEPPYSDGYYHNVDLCLFVDEALDSYHDLRPQLPSHFASIYVFLFLVDNGLFCLFDDINFCITLWNPVTREFRIRPVCNQNIPPKAETYGNVFGFGLDPLSNDYKVIYIRSYEDLEATTLPPNQYSVYNMSTDSWRVFNEEDVKFLYGHSVHNNNNNACVNGVYYWQAFGPGDDGSPYVLAFNLSTEVFQLIASPVSGRPFGQLLPLHNRIAMWDTVMPEPDVEISNDVWVLNDEGNWTKVLKIKPVLQVYKMFGFWRNGKVLVESVSGQFLLYDLESEEAKDLGIQTWMQEAGDYLCVHTYEESLVAVE